MFLSILNMITTSTKKAWELSLPSVPRFEAFALPNPKEQTTSEPTPIYKLSPYRPSAN